MHKLILLRHGQSEWNKENKFTGWTDVALTPQGVQEAKQAGKLLQEKNLEIDVAHTSVLKRDIKTLWLALEEADRMWIPVHRSWRLNERHYGALQGANKKEKAQEVGEEQVFIWRRSYDTPPPPLSKEDPRHAVHDKRYADITPPDTECLQDVVNRFVPYYQEHITADLRAGKTVLVAAHGNSLRALIKYLDGVSEQEIPHVNVPTGVPLVYELDKELKPIRSYYLGDQQAVKKKQQAVANQTK